MAVLPAKACTKFEAVGDIYKERPWQTSVIMNLNFFSSEVMNKDWSYGDIELSSQMLAVISYAAQEHIQLGCDWTTHRG